MQVAFKKKQTDVSDSSYRSAGQKVMQQPQNRRHISQNVSGNIYTEKQPELRSMKTRTRMAAVAKNSGFDSSKISGSIGTENKSQNEMTSMKISARLSGSEEMSNTDLPIQRANSDEMVSEKVSTATESEKDFDAELIKASELIVSHH